jgi:cell division protease FtsH
MLRQTQSGNNQALSFGRSRARLIAGDKPQITFADVAGVEEAKVELSEIVEFLKYPDKFTAVGARIPKGVLLVGPPGTGKTLLSKAVAGEAGVPFFSISGSEFVEMFVGVGASRVRDLFDQAKKNSPCIVFVDEIDAVGRQRGAGLGGGHDEREQTLNQLLVEMDGFETNTHVIVIAATNRPDVLDPALLRPGRFDRSIHFDLPSRAGRREIIDYYLGRKAHVAELDRDDRRAALAAMTSGYSPVMIEHLFDEGLVWALRDEREAMNWADVQQAKFTEEIGLKQPVEYTEAEKRTIATHEAGHAVVAHLVSPNRSLDVLSIIKRRGALGLLAHSDPEERFTQTATELRAMIDIAFGGMVAEELAFGQASTGPAGDLAYATGVAAQMVGSFGMGGTLVSYDAVEDGPIAAGIVGKVLGNEDARKRVEVLLVEAKEKVRRLLSENRHLVLALADTLVEREELIGEEITAVLVGAEAFRPAPRRSAADLTV